MSERAIVHGAPHDIGVALRDLQLDPPVRYLCRPIGPDFFLLGNQKAALWHQNSRYGGLAGEAREDGNLKTQARVKFSAARLEDPMWRSCFEIPST